MGFINSTSQFRFPVFDGKEFLTAEELKQISVLFEPIFPADNEQGVPGANDARAPLFLSCLLAISEEEYYKIPMWREAYREGLSLLNHAAQNIYDRNIQELDFSEAHEFLENMERNRLQGLPDDFNQRSFFKMLMEHCLKGCFSDPRWGGNNQGIMWRWLGWIQPAEDIKLSKNRYDEQN